MSRKIYLIPILVFVLTFALSCNVFASSIHGGSGQCDATGYNSWTQEEKEEFMDYVVRHDPRFGLYGWDCASDEILAEEYPQIYTQGYDTYLEFLVAHSTINEETGTITYDDSAMDFINFLKVAAEEQITYQYAYFPNSNNLKASDFNTLNCYSLIKAVIEKHPDKLFRIVPYYNNVYTDSEGVTHQGNGYQIYAFDMPYAGVCEYLDLASAPTTFYTEDWSAQFTYTEFFAFDVLNSDELDYMFGKNSEGVWTEWYSVEDLEAFDFELCNGFTGTNAIADKVAFSRKWYNGGLTYPVCVTNYTGAVPVFKSLADLKNGTTSGTCGQMMPNYSPGTITDNSITTNEVNEYVTNYNYYYGTGVTDSDDSGGSGSGSGLSSLLDGLGKLGDVIMSILGKLLDIIADIVEVLANAIEALVEVIPENVGVFFASIFSFVPEEWIKVITLGLTLSLVLMLIKIARG